ncbi:MAG: hypothetical protein OYH77_02645 [Pseudomonadota bacterium]|nr:hypothetical protein [Pseudomonadota bacterium]
MNSKAIFITALTALLLFACGRSTNLTNDSRVQAVADGKLTLGMVLVEADDKTKLMLAACDPNRRCINALQHPHDQSPYYFEALEDPSLRNKLRLRSALKLSASIAGAAALTAVGLVSIKHIAKLAKILQIKPSAVNANTSAAAIAIAVITAASISEYVWGKEERMLTKYWDDIFIVHANLDDNPKLIVTPVMGLLKTLATELQVEINPALRSS